MLCLRARIVLPLSGPPIENGFLTIQDGIIQRVGKWTEGHPTLESSQAMDLGESILLPGLVNAHCHLDYTHMLGSIPARRSFTDWIKSMVSLKSAWSYTDFAHSWMDGARSLVRTGTTTVADMEAVPELIPDMWEATPLRVISFREWIALKSGRGEESAFREIGDAWASLSHARCEVGLSPHAPYTMTPEHLRWARQWSRRLGWRLSTHVAESEEEFYMFKYGAGAMHEWLRSQREDGMLGTGSPVRYLQQCGYLHPGLLAVHVNYLDRGDAELLANQQVNVVHCPRSHAYFRHLRFPLKELSEAGVAVSLGTDSLASVNKNGAAPLRLSMFDEMRQLARTHTELSPLQILRMATVQGAAALGLEGRAGQLLANAWADCIAVPYEGELAHAVEAVVNHPGDVAASMIQGRWAIAPGARISQAS